VEEALLPPPERPDFEDALFLLAPLRELLLPDDMPFEAPPFLAVALPREADEPFEAEPPLREAEEPPLRDALRPPPLLFEEDFDALPFLAAPFDIVLEDAEPFLAAPPFDIMPPFFAAVFLEAAPFEEELPPFFAAPFDEAFEALPFLAAVFEEAFDALPFLAAAFLVAFAMF
jgi:hypothetical protein